MNINDIVNNVSSNVNVIDPNIQKASSDTVNLISSYSSTIKLLWIALGVLILLFVIAIIVYFVWFKNKRFLILIHMKNGSIERHKKRSFGNIIKITHDNKLSNGEKDIFPYIVDPLTIKSKIVQYFYRNPNPININPKLNNCSIEQQNIDQVLESDVIQKFVLAHDIVNTLKIVAIITLVIVCILGFGEYIIYTKPLSCNILQNITGV